MAAPIGNQYYLLRSKHGRDKKYSPTTFKKKANEYFQWCLDNPLQEQVIQKRKISRDEEVIEHHTINKIRPFTIQGFCNFAEIVYKTFLEYEQRDDFSEVSSRIRGIIENQQFEGAAAGFLNASIIARKLGLADKKELEVKELPPLFPDVRSDDSNQ